MAREKKTTKDDWITAQKAAELLTKQSGHPVGDAYVRRLGLAGKLETWQVDERTKLYLKSDVEGYTVKKRGTGEVRRAARRRKSQPEQVVA